jgi:hypothetical protein
MLLQYQPVMGNILKGKENFKQLIHGFAEVRKAFFPTGLLQQLKPRSAYNGCNNVVSAHTHACDGCAELEDEGAAQPHRRVRRR